MAKYSNVVEYSIITDVDSSGIVKLQNELTKLKQAMTFDKNSFARMGFSEAEINKSITKVNQLQTAITQAFNPKIGSLDLSKLNASLKTHHTSLQGIAKEWQNMGARGATAISSLSNALLSMNNNAVTVNTTLSKMANTFGNTVRWGITATIFQGMMSSIQGAVSYMRDLDDSLTQIQMVTNSSKENMRELAQYANQAAQALGSTTTDYTNAVKVFVQEGFSEAEAKQYANLSTKLANVSEQDTATTSDQITAYRNAFQLDYQQTVEAMDKVANVANNTASNVDELMTASQRSASVAQAVGVSQESFLASLATIQSVTRQTAEEIGNGMKTIYQRFADITVGGETDDGVKLGKYAKTLGAVGVDVLDAAGEFKGMDQIFKELMTVWGDLSDTMKIAVGETVAGKFQYNRFAALMNNADYYEKSLGATQNASGMMDQMNEYYVQGIEGRLKTLQAAGEQVMSTLFDQDAVEPVIENVTKLVNGLNEIVDAAGGLSGVLTALSAIMLKTFSSQIASSVTNIATGFSKMFANTRNANNFENVAMQLGLTGYNGSSLPGQLVSGIAENYGSLSPDTQAKVKELSEQLVQVEQNKKKVLEDQRKIYQDIALRAGDELQDRRAIIRARGEELKAAEKTSTGTEEERKNIERLKAEIQKAATEYIKLKEIQGVADTNVDRSINGVLVGTGDDDTSLSTLESHRSVLADMGIEFHDLEVHADEAGMALNSFGTAADTVKDRIKDFDLEATINRFTRLSGNITSIVFGAQMATESFRIWGDESATLEEKLSTTFTNGLMAITMLTPAIADIIKMYKAGELASLAWAAAERARAIASAIANAAMNPAILIPFLAITAVIGGLVVLYQSLGAEANAANAEFEKQREILSTVKKSATDAAEGLESLSKSIESIKSGEKTLETMTKGTDEWRDAVNKLNREVLALIETYPELAAQVESSNGVLSFKKDENGDALDNFYEGQAQEAARLQDTAIVQQVVTLESENDKLIADFGKKWEISTSTIKEALDKDVTALDSSVIKHEALTEEINSAFSSLQSSVDKNNATIEAVNGTIGTFNNKFTNYAESSVSKEDVEAQKQNIQAQYSTGLQSDGEGHTYDYGFRFNDAAINDSLINEVSEAIGQKLISGERSGKEISFKPSDGGQELKYTDEELLQVLADYRAAKEIEKRVIEDNTKIYAAFGGALNDMTGEITDANNRNRTVTSLTDLMTTENIRDLTHENSIGLQSADSISDIQNYFNTELDLEISDESAQKIRDSIQEKINNDPLDISRFKTSSNFVAADNAIKENKRFGRDVYDSIQTYGEDGTVGSFLDDGTVSSYTAASTKLTEVLGEETDAFELLEEKTLNSQLAMAKLEQSQVDLNLVIDSTNLDAKADQLDTLAEKIEEVTAAENSVDLNALGAEEKESLGGLGIDVNLNYNGDEYTNIDDITAQIADKIREIEQEEFAIRISANAEGIDAANDMVNALSNATDAAMAINEDYTVSFEDIEDVASAFPGILGENGQAYEVYANGTIQLNRDIADAAIASANSDRESTVQAQVDKIDALIAYDDALIAEYDNQINAAAQLAEQNGLTEKEYNDFVTESRNHLQEVDREYNQNVLENAEKGAQGQQNIVQQFVDRVGAAFQGLGQIAGAIWNFIFNGGSWDNVANTVSSVGEAISGNNGGASSGVQWTPNEKMASYGKQLASERQGIQNQRRELEAARARLLAGQIRSQTAQEIPTHDSRMKDPSKEKDSTPKESSVKDAQIKEAPGSEWDYLTDIVNDLDRAADVMEKMAKLEDRLYGRNRISQLKKLQGEYKHYIQLLEQQEALEKQHAERLRTNAYDENGNLTISGYAYRGGVGALQFDGQGNLDNGREIELGLLNRLNSAVDEYNVHRNDDDAKRYENRVNQAQSDYDGFLKALSEYESTLGKIEDTQDAIQDYKEKIQDAADAVVDAIQQGIQDMLDAMDNQRDFNKLFRDWMEGGSGYSHFGNSRQYYTEGLENLFSTKSGGRSIFDLQLTSLQDRITDAQSVIDGNSSDADDEKLSEQAAFENLQEATGNILDTVKTAIEYYDSLLQTVEEASSKMDELIDNRLNEFNRIEEYLDTRLDQVKLLFGDKSYQDQTLLYNQKIETNMEKMVSINSAIEAKQATVKSLEKLEASGKELSTEERKALQEAREKVNELQKEQLQTETKLLQDIASKLRTQTSKEMNDLISGMFNGADIDWLSQQWEIATRNSEKYLDDYNRAYEIQKLQLKFQEALNNSQTNSLGTQQKINDLANEYLTYLREKNNLSEYDVKHAQMELDILQKQIALEDARNNKSQMQLQRNAAGNYDFVYAADEDAIAQATEALITAQQESYNLSKQIYLETYESAFEAAIKTRDMVVEVATDASLSVEERTERIKFILESLGEYMGNSSIELGEISINLYNSFVDAERMIAEENQGALSAIFEQMRAESLATQQALMADTAALHENTTAGFYETSEAINGSFGGIRDNALTTTEETVLGVDEGFMRIHDSSTTNLGETAMAFDEHIGAIRDNALTSIDETSSGLAGGFEKMRLDSDMTAENIQSRIADTVLNFQDNLGIVDSDTSSRMGNIQETIFGTVTTTEENISGSLQKIKHDANAQSSEIQNRVINVISQIDSRFLTSKDNTIAKVNDIDNKIREANNKITGSGGYLQQFENATQSTLRVAGDDYKSFTRDSIDYASNQLNHLRDNTKSWQGDLKNLKQEIDNCAGAMAIWKDKIDRALNSAVPLVTAANYLQVSLSGDGAAASVAGAMLDGLATSADNTGQAVESMANRINDSYQAIIDTAGAAETAYRGMEDAARAAAGGYTDMADAARQARDMANEAASAARQAAEDFNRLPEGANTTWNNAVTIDLPDIWGLFWKGYGTDVARHWGPQMYDTGGYTGTWTDQGVLGDDKDGKWAILHKKELVLNQTDTENMLSAIEIVRDITSGINSLSSIRRGVINSNYNNNTVDQRVEINATFPGVTEVIEIKQALEQIADSAYQEAHRYSY